MEIIPEGNYRVKVKRILIETKNPLRASYLRVTRKGKDKYFQVDHSEPFKVAEEDEEFELRRFEVISEIKEGISIHKPKISVSFQDNEGYMILMEVNTIQAFNKIMSQFPRLNKALNLKT